MSLKTVHGFNVLPLRFSKESSSHHEILFKEHSVRKYDERKPPGKTLFVINVPPYVTGKSLKNAFANAGKVKYVVIQKSITDNEDNTAALMNGFKVAFVVFEKRDGLTKALKLTHLNTLSTVEEPLLTGLNKWVKEYNNSICDHTKLQDEVNKFIESYDREEETKKHKDKEGLVDDEGWTIVTKTGRNPGLSRKESLENKLNEKSKVKSKKKELKNFYPFQIKENKMKVIADLRKKYEEDKLRVQAMKSTRKYRPY